MTPGPSEKPLESWKEIASFLNRDIRTVQRWEKAEGLPVHRHLHDKAASVYAYPEELERWRLGRSGSHPTMEITEPEEDPFESEGLPELKVPLPPTAKDDNPRQPGSPGSAPRWRWARWSVLVVAGILLGVWATWHVLRASSRTRNAIAVLPFTNLGGGVGDDYLSDGVTEDIITELNRLHAGGAPIAALGSPLWYKNKSKTPRQIAAELRVDYLLEGTVRRSGDRVRIAVHLLRAQDEFHLWDENYDSDLRDILSLQRSVAETIAGNISQRVDRSTARLPKQVNDRAYEAFLKGRYFWNKRDPASLMKALHFLQEAAALDGTYAPVHVGLADCYALLGSAEMGAMAPNEAMPLAKGAVTRALALDPDLAEAHASLAHILLIYEWNWAGAQHEFRRAIQLNPRSATAHQWFALYHNALGQTEEALAELRIAEHLNPLSPTLKTAFAETYYFARRYEEAEAAARAALEMEPGFLLGLMNLGRALEKQGRYPEALEVLRQGWIGSGKGPGMTMLLGYAYARQGNSAKAREMLQELQHPPVYGGRPLYVPSLYTAVLHNGLGEKQETFANLEKAISERCEYLIYAWQDPMADPLREDPRFHALIRAVGLKPLGPGRAEPVAP
jgi:TolB-like protein